MSIKTGTKMSFSEALQLLKEGNRVLRVGWNGKGMWLEAQTPDEHSKMQRPYVFISDAEQSLVPWNPSQTDLFAEDWEVWCDECANKGHVFIDERKTPCGACAQ